MTSTLPMPDLAGLLLLGPTPLRRHLRSRTPLPHAEPAVAASPAEAFAVACAAPFREVRASALTPIGRPGRPAVGLSALPLPGRASWWRRPLWHEFGVSDADEAESCVRRLILDASASASPAKATYHYACAIHIATAAAGLGLVDAATALEWARPATDALAALHEDWTSFARSFLAGVRSVGGTPLRTTVFTQAVLRLRTDARSPWQSLPWPAPTRGA